MRELLFAVAVWGKDYVDTFLRLALPSFLAPGNIPACAKLTSIRFTVVTRPEDVALFEGSPVVDELRRFASLNILPLLTADQFEGDRYAVMARAHRHAIRQGLSGRVILSILSPDCIIANGSLEFGLRRILGGNLAVNVAGARAVLEDVAPILTSEPFCRDGKVITAAAPDLVSLLTQHLHPISRLLYWNADPFSAYPSAIYWPVSRESLLAHYFHLHPLFVDLSGADSEAGRSGTIDGSLLTLANIPTRRIFTATRSDDVCIVELSCMAHDPMGARPVKIQDKATFIAEWARREAGSPHIAQFMSHTFLFRGRESVDWDATIASSTREMTDVFAGLRNLEKERRQEGREAARAAFRASVEKAGLAIWLLHRIFHRLSALLTPGPAIWIARFLWPLMRVVRDLIRLLRGWISGGWFPPAAFTGALRHDYDIRVVPYRAQHPGPFARLLHRALRASGIVFVVNMASGMGHNTVELDYFLRLSRSGQTPPRRYVLLRIPGSIHNDTLALYRRNFWFASNSALLNDFLSPVIARCKDIRLSVGLSRLRWQLRDDGSWSLPLDGQTYLYQVSKAENRAEWTRYYKLRSETRDMTPLKDGLAIEPALLSFLGGSVGRLALIHVKYHVVNATARPTDPLTYLPAIRWLREQGYRVVMIGREKMPAEFAALGVLDYAGWPQACYRYDLELVAHAAIVITAGSGISLMPDCMDVPLVYLNSWHVGMPMASERCVMVPTLVMERASGRLLTVAEQCNLYWTLEDKGAEVFPARDYEPREATEDEVLEAVKEAIAINPDEALTACQHDYRRLTTKEQEAFVGARVSQYFIDKHAHLLGGPDVNVRRRIAGAG